jgi:phosphoadenosine phosphosulfate reductase
LVPSDAPSGTTELLRWTHARFGDQAVIASSLGPQSLVLIDILHDLGLSLPVLLLDTGLLFEETHALRHQVELRYGITIETAEPLQTLAQQEATEGPELWRSQPDRCCELRKVRPLAKALSSRAAWITGLRRGPGGGRSGIAEVEWDHQFNLLKINPLADWNREDVSAYLEEHQVPYNPLLDEGYRSLGCVPCTSRVSSLTPLDDERAGRWANHQKSECGIHPPPPQKAK